MYVKHSSTKFHLAFFRSSHFLFSGENRTEHLQDILACVFTTRLKMTLVLEDFIAMKADIAVTKSFIHSENKI